MVSEETTYTNGVIDLTARLAAMIMSPFKEHMVEKVEEVKTLQTPPSEAAIPAMEAIRKLFSEYETPEQATTRNETEVIEEIGDVERADRQVRTEKLRAIALDLHQLWCAGPTVLAKAAKIIADGSRDKKWRIPMGDSGLLDAFLMMISSEAQFDTTLTIHVLRMIGNCCAHIIENRARVVASGAIKHIVKYTLHDALLAYAVPVLMNVCYSYEPAIKQASEAELTPILIDWLGDLKPDELISHPQIFYVCRLLAMVQDMPDEEGIASDNTLERLLALAMTIEKDNDEDQEMFAVALSLINKRLEMGRFMHLAVNTPIIDGLLKLYNLIYRVDRQVTEELKQQGVDLLNNLCEIAFMDEFYNYCVEGCSTETILLRNLTMSQAEVQACGCVMLGNLARNDARAKYFVLDKQIHKPLIMILATSQNTNTLQSAVGFLKNLSIASENKVEIGECRIDEIFPRVWGLDTHQQLQYMSISMCRLLMSGNQANVSRLTAPLSQDAASPASERSKLSLLLSLFSRSDAEPVKMEIARTVANVCRVMTTDYGRGSSTEAMIRKDFFDKHADIVKPLSYMVLNKKWPAVRSEGWFILALLARTDESVGYAADLLCDAEIFNLLMEAIMGNTMAVESKPNSRPGSSSSELAAQLMAANAEPQHVSLEDHKKMRPQDTKRIDRENTLILMSEVLKRAGNSIDDLRRTAFEKLLEEGGHLHLLESQK